MSAIEIPNKSSYKIGEVAEFLQLEAYVLRYWETEFDQLKPRKTRSGQRAYNRSDIDLLIRIKGLLYDDMYTIAGARRRLEESQTTQALLTNADEAQAQMISELSSLQSRAKELEMANQNLERTIDTQKQRIEELERIDETLVFFPSSTSAELEGLRSRVEELELANDELSQQLGRVAQARRSHLALVRRELETMSRLAAN